MRLLTVSICVLFCSITISTAADPPEALNYQGVLRDAADNPVSDGDYAMVFRLCSDPDFGNPLFCDSQSVPVSGGLFSARIGESAVACLGETEPASLSWVLSQHSPIYLQIEVGGEQLWPRVPLASAPYSLNARTVRGTEIVSPGPLDLFVDRGHPDADDANDGLSPDKPKETIQSAVNAIPLIIGGDVTVHIANGVYNEQVWLAARNRTAIGFTRLVGADAHGVVLNGTGISWPGIGIIISDPAAIISGITVENFDTESAIHVFGGGSLELYNSRIVSNNAFSGIDVTGGSTVDIYDCEFIDNDTAIRARKGGHVRLFDTAGSVFQANSYGMWAERNSSIAFQGGGTNCSMTASPMWAADHSTIHGYQSCSRDMVSDCTIGDASARCVP